MLSEMNVARRRRSPTSSSRTPISTTWARSPSFPTPTSISRRASCSPGMRRSRCRKRFGYLTAIIDPDNLRTALDASIEHRVTLVDGDKDNVLPGIHVRLGSGHTIGQQFVVIETARGPAADLRRLRLFATPVHRPQATTASTCRSTTPSGSVWEQLKTIDKMNDELGGDLGRLVDSARHRTLEGIAGRQGGRGFPDRQGRVKERTQAGEGRARAGSGRSDGRRKTCPQASCTPRSNRLRRPDRGWRRDATPNDHTWLPSCSGSTSLRQARRGGGG